MAPAEGTAGIGGHGGPRLPPPPRVLQWTVLLGLSAADAARAYGYDSIAPAARLLSVQVHCSNADLGLLQACSSLASLLMVLPGGVLVDRLGAKRATTLFAILCLAGTAITAQRPSLGQMLVGRLVFGAGAGSLSVAVSTGLANWYRGPGPNLVFGLSLALARLGALLAQTSPAWAAWAYGNWRLPLCLAVLVAAIGLLCAISCWALENLATGRFAIGQLHRTVDDSGHGTQAGSGRSYILIVLLSVAFYGSLLPFQTFAQKLLIEAHHVSQSRAALLMGVPLFIAMGGSPLFGLLADRVGRTGLFLLVGQAMLVPAFLLVGSNVMGPLLPVILMGLALALVPTLVFPAIMAQVPRERLGKAFGLMSMASGAGLVGVNFLVGVLNDRCRAGAGNPGGYASGLWVFTLLALVGLGAAVMLVRDARRVAARPAAQNVRVPSDRSC